MFVLQEDLKEALVDVTRAVATRSTLPVLGCVLFDVQGARLRLVAHNLELGINRWIPLQRLNFTEFWQLAVPARIITEWVGAIGPELIEFKVDQKTSTLAGKAGRYESNFKGMDPMEFPDPPAPPEDLPALKLAPEVLGRMAKEIIFATAADESRPVFTGINTILDSRKSGSESGKLTMVAADGFRLSHKTIHPNLSEEKEGVRSIIVPRPAIQELVRLSKDFEEPVGVVFDDRRIWFLIGEDCRINSQLIEGEFPDYKRIIPVRHTCRVTFLASELSRTLRTCQLFARDSANICRFNIAPAVNFPEDKSTVTISASSAELGDNVTVLEAGTFVNGKSLVEVEGDPLEIAFNVKYTLDFLASIESELVTLEGTNPNNPGVWRPVGEGDQPECVIMPMHIH